MVFPRAAFSGRRANSVLCVLDESRSTIRAYTEGEIVAYPLVQ
jgi:hypothetical protein